VFKVAVQFVLKAAEHCAQADQPNRGDFTRPIAVNARSIYLPPSAGWLSAGVSPPYHERAFALLTWHPYCAIFHTLVWLFAATCQEHPMHLPIIHGTIARRLLVNYRVDPDVIARILPPPFRPKRVHGFAIAGICLIRLQAIRPRGVPAVLGLTSENAAHRIAVEWEDHGQSREGVYIPRRDTNSRVNTWIGGRLFPGMHHHATFATAETDTRISIAFTSADTRIRVRVAGQPTPTFPHGSLFGSLAEVSTFFERGALGYSVTRDSHRFDGLELRSHHWQMTPFLVDQVDSTFFADTTVFPTGSVSFDGAVLMRGIPHEWHAHDQLCSTPGRTHYN
jgi:Uncharacterized conserved protein (COG2071)